jgi:glycosyltransferase involved in cell wall biosynthesis
MPGIFFDARYIRPEFHDGISRFSSNLFAALARVSDVTAVISDERQLDRLPAGTKWVKLHAPTSVLEPFSSLRLNRFKPDVVFSPMQTIGSLGRKFKLILTIHDFIYYHHTEPPQKLPGFVRFGWRLYHLTYLPQRMLLAGCDAVACVSEVTAAEVAERRLTKKPIALIYNAPERRILKSIERSPEKSLVYMGSFMGYKNVETLIRGVAKLPGYKLELLSPIEAKIRTRLQALADDLDAQVVFHNGVSDEEYIEILEHSTALVSASLDEGFGLPVVEAMSRGVPVILSDIPIFHEVAGECGRYFEATDSDEFAKLVRQVQKRPASAQELVARAGNFDWDSSAQNLLRLIGSL